MDNASGEWIRRPNEELANGMDQMKLTKKRTNGVPEWMDMDA
jgi:hypothetical protein